MDGQTDITKVLFAFHNFANTPKNNAIKTCLILQWFHITHYEIWHLLTINSCTM